MFSNPVLAANLLRAGGSGSSPNPGILAAGMFSWNGATISTIGQKNIASVTRTAGGKFRVSFSSALSNSNYGLLATARRSASAADDTILIQPDRNTSGGGGQYSTTTLDLFCTNALGTAIDPELFAVVVFDPANVGSDYLAACCVTVSGTTPTVASQTNVASAPRQATGVYTPTFTAALAAADYSVFGTTRYPDFTGDASAFFGRNRNTTGPQNRQTTGLVDLSVGQIANTSSSVSYEPGRFSMLARNSDVAPAGTLAAARFSVSGSTCTLIKSHNVSSVTYQTTGCYRVNFASALADIDYMAFANGKWGDFTNTDAPLVGMNNNSFNSRNARTTNAVDLVVDNWGSGSGPFNAAIVDVWVVKPWLM